MLRSFFISMSRNRTVRGLSERSSIGRKLSSRFVAGMTVEEALDAAAAVNREGMAVSLDLLGESVTDAGQARASAEVYHELLDAIRERGLNANVSVKLTQVGMDVDPALAEATVAEMLGWAEAADSFVRIDMEGSEYTEATIAMTERLHARCPGQGGDGAAGVSFSHGGRCEAAGERRDSDTALQGGLQGAGDDCVSG